MRKVDLVGPHGYEHGWKFVGVPGVTSHSDLLKMRKEARAAHPQGHPERLKAERAVRDSRKLGATQKAATGDRSFRQTNPGESPNPLQRRFAQVKQSEAERTGQEATLRRKGIPPPMTNEQAVAARQAEIANRTSRPRPSAGRRAGPPLSSMPVTPGESPSGLGGGGTGVTFGETNALGQAVHYNGKKIGHVKKNTSGSQIIGPGKIKIGSTAPRGWRASEAVSGRSITTTARTRAAAADALVRNHKRGTPGESPSGLSGAARGTMAIATHRGGKVTREDTAALPAALNQLSPAERDYIMRTHEIHVSTGRDIKNVIDNLGINAAHVDYGAPTGLQHENKIIVTRSGLTNGDLLHEIGHAIDKKVGGTRTSPGHDEFALGINAAISRELKAGGSQHAHFGTTTSAGSAAKERWAELFSQYRSGKRQYRLGSKLSPELSGRITSYFQRTLDTGGSQATGTTTTSLSNAIELVGRTLGLSAETPRLVATPAPLGKPGGPGLYHLKGAKLPNYIENMRNALMRGGMSEGRATATAISRCKVLAATSKHPEVKAAAAAAIAELKATALRAKAAHGHANEPGQVVELFNQFHLPVGPGGGRFTTASGASGGAKAPAKSPKGAQRGTPSGYGRSPGAAQAAIKKRIAGLKKQIRAQSITLSGLVAQRQSLIGSTTRVAKVKKGAKKTTTRKAGTKAKTTTTAKKKTQGAAKKASAATTRATNAAHIARLGMRISQLRTQIKNERAQVRQLSARI